MLVCLDDNFGDSLNCLFQENGQYFGLMLTLEIVWWLAVIFGIASLRRFLFLRNTSKHNSEEQSNDS
tara:strand:- start:12749 stop:12949 length:201 start_codon:yes stop_codon:yes gene_type:complete